MPFAGFNVVAFASFLFSSSYPSPSPSHSNLILIYTLCSTSPRAITRSVVKSDIVCDDSLSIVGQTTRRVCVVTPWGHVY